MRLSLPKTTLLIFLAGILLIVFSLLRLTVIPRQRRAISDAKRTLATLQEKNAKLTDMLSRIKTIDANLKLLRTAVPEDDNVPFLMTQLEQLGKNSGVVVRHLGFSGGESNPTAKVGEPTAGASGSVQKISLTVVVTGTYSNLLSFLKNVEQTSRVVNVTNLRFSPAATESEQNDELSATLGITAYYLSLPGSPSSEQPLSLDISSPAYINLIKQLKSLRVYEPETTP